jgi:pyruvate-formate lyase-activating enzyme
VAVVIEDLTFLDRGRVAARNCQVNLTTCCSRRCLFCPQSSGRAGLPAGAVESGLRAYARRRGRVLRRTELILTGGEPAFSPDLLPAARLGRDLGFRSITLLSSPAPFADADFARSVHRAGVGRLFLSLHSCRPEVHDLLTGEKGGFAAAVEGLSRCLRMGFEHVTCNMVLTKLNWRDIPATARFLAGLKRRAGPGPSPALFVSTMEENPWWDRLSVPHSRAVPGVLQAVREGRVPLMRFMGDWAMPACVGGLASRAPGLIPLGRMDSRTWRAPEGWAPAVLPSPEACRRVKALQCRRCALDRVCGGLSRVYAERYGVDELSALAGPLPRAGRGQVFIV